MLKGDIIETTPVLKGMDFNKSRDVKMMVTQQDKMLRIHISDI